MTEHLLTIPETSHILGVSAPTVSRILNDGEISSVIAGGHKLIDSASLESYLSSNNLVAAPEDHPLVEEPSNSPIALSFFSGALGLDLGMEMAGIKSRLYCEFDRKCRMTIAANRPNPALLGDITKIDASTVREFAKLRSSQTIDVVFGGPPCQAFSTAGARRAFSDRRGNVFLRYLDLIEELRPTYVIIENVRGLLSTPWPLKEGEPPSKGGAMALILKTFRSFGYNVTFELYNAANFGAPQIRERVVLIGKLGGSVSHLTPTNSENGSFGLPRWRTFGDAVANLPAQPCHHSEFPPERLRFLQMIGEGQCWTDLPEEVKPEAMGKSYKLPGGKTGFYRRVSFSRPCPTLVTSPTMPATYLAHPIEDRPLSVEEYKRVQGFPDKWRICGNISDQYKQIGNAVPIALGKAIGDTIIADMNGAPLQSPEGFRFSRYKNTSEETWHPTPLLPK